LIPCSERISLFTTAFRPVLESTQHPIEWALVLKWPKHEADHSNPSNGGAIPPLPPHIFRV